MTWLLKPNFIMASDIGWGKKSAIGGYAVPAIHAFYGLNDGSELADSQLPRILPFRTAPICQRSPHYSELVLE